MANEFRIRFSGEYAEILIYLFFLIRDNNLLEGVADKYTIRDVTEVAEWFEHAYDVYKAKKLVEEKWRI